LAKKYGKFNPPKNEVDLKAQNEEIEKCIRDAERSHLGDKNQIVQKKKELLESKKAQLENARGKFQEALQYFG
jgi:hypothetical protein